MGDQNTTCFLRVAQMRNSQNYIRSFTFDAGLIISEPTEMSHMAIDHHQNILQPASLPPLTITYGWIHTLTDFRTDQATKALMSTVPTAEKIFKVINKLNPNKSPGPDGLTSGFFKSARPIVGRETTEGILHFFRTYFMPTAVNSTILTLVPKKLGATKVVDSIPISCCSTLYKTISKPLVVRLKPLLPNLILPNQNAFIKDRLLVENMVLAA